MCRKGRRKQSGKRGTRHAAEAECVFVARQRCILKQAESYCVCFHHEKFSWPPCPHLESGFFLVNNFFFLHREAGLDENEVVSETNFEDEFRRMTPISHSSKLKAFDCYVDQTGTGKVLELIFYS